MSYVVGIDIGGTFTDAFATDDAGNVASAKSRSTPPDYSRGVLGAIRELAATLGVDVAALLGETDYICHGTTSSLNALITGDTANIGFLTTRGHADSIYIMNLEGRYAGLDPERIQDMVRTNKPEPLLPRRLVHELDERIDYKGAEIVPLDENGVREAVKELIDAGVEGIAVSLLWSFRNPTHETRVREIIGEIEPSMYVGLSSELSPRIREYPRSATTVMSTQVGPILRSYLQPLRSELADLGFTGALLVMQGAGGSIPADDAPGQAITTIGSVLTGGVVGCNHLARELGHTDIISTDMGGTTFLVGMVVDGTPVTAPTTTLKQYTLNVPMVKVNTIGSGGGAIARVDAGGNLRVGPRSAGAHPGPACYDEGGVEPTITDADLLLGILNPDYFLGGRQRLRTELAEQALTKYVAEPLGMTAQDAAAAIFAITNAQTADLVRRVVVNNGYDPRDFVLYAFGGAAPVHCANYSVDLGARQVLVPLGSTAATFSAYGLAASDIVLSAELSQPENFPPPTERVNAAFDSLERELSERLATQNTRFSEVTMRREIDARYTMQLAEVATPVANGSLNEAEVHGIGNEFEALYERLYGKGAGFREAGIQLITYRVFATGHLPAQPRLPELPRGSGAPPTNGSRRAYLSPDSGYVDAAILDYATLMAGHEVSGPAIVEAPTTTVAVPPGVAGRIDRLGNLILALA
jgi:N-methylhydantoinase A